MSLYKIEHFVATNTEDIKQAEKQMLHQIDVADLDLLKSNTSASSINMSSSLKGNLKQLKTMSFGA